MKRFIIIFLIVYWSVVCLPAATLIVTNLNESGPGSLRQALEDAADGDIVEVPLFGQISTGGSPFVIDKDIILRGPSSGQLTLDGRNSSAVIWVQNATVTIERLSISAAGSDGSGISGGIFASGDVTLVRCRVSRCRGGTGDNAAGGITIDGSLTIQDSTVIQCSGEGGGGILARPNSTLLVERCQFEGNSGFYSGGGIRTAGTAVIRDTTFEENHAGDGSGGGVMNEGGGSLRIERCTFEGNTQTSIPPFASELSGGAAIYNRSGTLHMENSTVSGNQGVGRGAGLWNRGTASLTYCTVVNNTVTGKDLDPATGGGIYNEGTLRLKNSIVALNDAPNPPPGEEADDVFGAFTSLGGNLIGDATGAIFTPQTGDQSGTAANPLNPLIGPLTTEFGTAHVHPLLPGSPAIDAAPCDTITIDQRGIARPQGSGCDSGAFELRTKPGVLMVESRNRSGLGSLRQTIANTLAGDVIEFAVTGTIQDAFLTINRDITIKGPGAGSLVLDGNNENLIFLIGNASVTIQDLTIANGGRGESASEKAIESSGDLTVIRCLFTRIGARHSGGGINSSRSLVIRDSTFFNCFDAEGAAISATRGYLCIERCRFESNAAEHNGGAIANLGNAILRDSMLTDNVAGDGVAGAIYNSGTMQIERCTFNGNIQSAQERGPGIGGGVIWNRAETGSMEIVNSTFTGNRSNGSGGAIWNGGHLSLTYCTIVDNSAVPQEGDFANGGGINNVGTLKLKNTIVALNTAPTPRVGQESNDIFGSLTSLGGNLIGDATGASFTPQPTDQFGNTAAPLNPLLGPLSDNGGFTLTLALLPGSPAIDAAPCSDVHIDQRGVSRPQGKSCDTGAFELVQKCENDTTPPTVVVERIDKGPPVRLFIEIADACSGLASIKVTKAVNATVQLPDFTPGDKGPLLAVATKIDSGKSSIVEIEATDMAGNSFRGDPVITTLETPQGGTTAQRFGSIPQAEGFITVQSGSPGMARLLVRVNNTATWMLRLGAGQTRFLDVSSAMLPGNDNIVDLIGTGEPGATALVIIADSAQVPVIAPGEGAPGEGAPVLSPHGVQGSPNLIWGHVVKTVSPAAR